MIAAEPQVRRIRRAALELASNRWEGPLPQPAPLPDKVPHHLRLVSLNVAHGRRRVPHQTLVRRRTMHFNLLEIANRLRQSTPDLVALQEADGPSVWSGNFDHVATLAELAELRQAYRGEHNPFRLGRFALSSGTALLGRYPLHEPASHRFGLSWRDTKGFVVATVVVPEWGDTAVDVVSVHLDFLAPRVRRRQVTRLVEALRGRRRPLVLLGDLNCCWHREPHTLQRLSQELGLRAFQPAADRPTYPTYLPRRRLDWILVTPELDFAGYHNLPARVSDHLGVVADLSLRKTS